MAKFSDITWEDDDTLLESKKDDHSEFEALLAGESFDAIELRTGEEVSGVILAIPQDSNDILIEISPSQTGVLDKMDLLDENGLLSKAVGDTVTAYVLSMAEGSVQLSTKLGKSQQAEKDLEMAQATGLPVKGKVIKDTKGGFEVSIFGKTAFCPVSQIDTRFVENKADYIGKDLEFLITKVDARGRNIVVSRARLLQKKAMQRMEELKGMAGGEEILDGVVTQLRDYGAFVDIGGVDGFLHISEISHARIERPGDVLTPGENVRVKILKIEEKDGRPRISLSMRAVVQDPWSVVREEFRELETYPGTVVSLSKHGAFVSLKPGLEGLVHLSELSWDKRIHNAADVVQVGDAVNVRILAIDLDKKRISLSLKDVAKDPWKDIAELKGSTISGKVERLKGFGAIVEIKPGVSGLLPLRTLKAAYGESYRRHASPPKAIEVVVGDVDLDAKKLVLTLPNIEAEEDDSDYQAYLEQQERVTEKAPQSGKATGTFGQILAQKLAKK